MHYARRSPSKIIFELRQGMVARGASIAWLSQHPAEAEVLLERRVASIELLEPGSGYRVDQPLEVTVTAPQVPCL